jgi:hypothetical protein
MSIKYARLREGVSNRFPERKGAYLSCVLLIMGQQQNSRNDCLLQLLLLPDMWSLKIS